MEKCHESIPDHAGFYFRECGRRAKYSIKYKESGRVKYVCGLHKRVNTDYWEIKKLEDKK